MQYEDPGQLAYRNMLQFWQTGFNPVQAFIEGKQLKEKMAQARLDTILKQQQADLYPLEKQARIADIEQKTALAPYLAQASMARSGMLFNDLPGMDVGIHDAFKQSQDMKVQLEKMKAQLADKTLAKKNKQFYDKLQQDYTLKTTEYSLLRKRIKQQGDDINSRIELRAAAAKRIGDRTKMSEQDRILYNGAVRRYSEAQRIMNDFMTSDEQRMTALKGMQDAADDMDNVMKKYGNSTNTFTPTEIPDQKSGAPAAPGAGNVDRIPNPYIDALRGLF